MLTTKKQSTTIFWFSLLALLMVLTAACSAAEAATPITDITWAWTSMFETEPATPSMVPTPENYLLILKADGSLDIKADCNGVGGAYTLEDNALTIELGPSTLMYCGDDSIDYMFTGMLSGVESYSIVDGELVLELADGAGQMFFTQQ